MSLDLREIQFGSITIKTDSFNKEIYNPLFEARNLPLESEHPFNWSVGRFRENHQALGIPLDNLTKLQLEEIIKESKTRLTKEDIEERNQVAFQQQVCKDSLASYEESKGFFEDFINAYIFAKNLRRVGINAWSGRIHSSTYVIGEGESEMISKEGRTYLISPNINICGLAHENSFTFQIVMPFDYKQKGEMKALYNFVINKDWDGGVLEPCYIQVSRNGGPWHDEVDGYNLVRKDLEVYADINYPVTFDNIGLYGRLGNYEEFSQWLIDGLDEHFIQT